MTGPLTHARQNPIGATCATALGVAFYTVPTYAMFDEIGWWSTLMVPALLAFCGVFILAIDFLTGLE